MQYFTFPTKPQLTQTGHESLEGVCPTVDLGGGEVAELLALPPAAVLTRAPRLLTYTATQTRVQISGEKPSFMEIKT